MRASFECMSFVDVLWDNFFGEKQIFVKKCHFGRHSKFFFCGAILILHAAIAFFFLVGLGQCDTSKMKILPDAQKLFPGDVLHRRVHQPKVAAGSPAVLFASTKKLDQHKKRVCSSKNTEPGMRQLLPTGLSMLVKMVPSKRQREGFFMVKTTATVPMVFSFLSGGW